MMYAVGPVYRVFHGARHVACCTTVNPHMRAVVVDRVGPVALITPFAVAAIVMTVHVRIIYAERVEERLRLTLYLACPLRT